VKIGGKLRAGKTGFNASAQPNSSITTVIHVGPNDDRFAGLNIHRTSRAGEGLFIDVAVKEHPPVDQFTAR
jgi:hypothetical protein